MNSKTKSLLITVLMWFFSVSGFFFTLILLFAGIEGALIVLLSSLLIFPPAYSWYSKKLKLRIRYAFILATILFFTGFIVSISLSKVSAETFESSIKRRAPTTLEAKSQRPDVYLRYYCGLYTEKVSVNGELLNEKEKSELCGERYNISLVDGVNEYKIVFFADDKEYAETVKISFDLAAYNKNQQEAKLKAEQEAKEKAELEAKKKVEAEAQEKARLEQARKDYLTYANNVSAFSKEVSNRMTNFSKSTSDYNSYLIAKGIKQLGLNCSVRNYPEKTDKYPSKVKKGLEELEDSIDQYCLDIYGWGDRVMRYLDGKSNSMSDLELIESYSNDIVNGSLTVGLQVISVANDLGVDINKIK